MAKKTTTILDIALSRQIVENEFISALKEKNPMSENEEANLRRGFLAGFYEAYKKLPELNKVHRQELRRRSSKAKSPVLA